MRSMTSSIRPSNTTTQTNTDARPLPANLNPVTPADLAAIDGTAPSPGVEPPAAIPGVAPELPEAEGPRATPHKISELLPRSVGTDANELPLDMFCMAMMALQILTEGAREAWRQQAAMKRVAETQRTAIKGKTIQSAVDRIEGERRRGGVNLFGSILSTTASGLAGYKGARMSISQVPDIMSKGQAIASMANSLGSVLQGGVQWADKTLSFGGARRADDADVRQRFLQRDEDIAQQAIEAARSVHESMKQQLQKAQQAVIDFNDRRNQAINALQR
jgi:hypothetical protein